MTSGDGKRMTWTSVWITGGSSGIGRELAIRMARRGIRVAISARSAEALAQVAASHPGITAYPLDVTDRQAAAETAARIAAAQGPIDLAVLSAGIFKPMGAGRFNAETAAQSMAINYGGICNALEALIPAMSARGSGQIALLSSVAGYCGLPKMCAYSPSKAAVNALAESLAPELEAKGIVLQLVTPGYIETHMTEGNPLSMPFLMPLDKAVDALEAGLARRRFEIVFPWQMAIMMKLYRRASYPLFFWIARTFLTPPPKRHDGTASSADV